MASVELIDVVERCDKQTMFQPLDLTISDGSFTILVDPFGCGKSTLLRLLADLETLSGGTILTNRRPINDLDPADRSVAIVFQSYAFYPHPTVVEDLALHIQVRKVDKQLQKSEVQQIASLLGTDKLLVRYPRTFSGGQRQRVVVGRTMVRNPQVFLFNEPLSNLDAQLRMELRAEIKPPHQRINTTMIYVTHDQVEAMILADQIVVMRDGQVIRQGAPLAIYNQSCSTFVTRFIGSPSMNPLPDQHAVRDSQLGVARDTLWFPLAERQHQAVTQQGDAPLIVGLRPQGILSDAHDAPATVDITEVTGKSILLYLD